jgi:hypothetical protein
MPYLLSTALLAQGFDSTLIAQQAAGVLDLLGLAAGIWVVWSTLSLPIGGNFQRAFRLIGLGSLAFAISHLIDSLVSDTHLLSSEQLVLLMQGMVLISLLFFVPGLAGLADTLPLLSHRQLVPLPRFWPFAVALVIIIGMFSFILYGVSPEAETVAFVGLDGSIIIITGLCMLLLLRARIGGAIGYSLWLVLLGLLVFSLAHPLQAWLYLETNLPSSTLAVLHRLIVMPALLLFALSVTRLSRKLSTSLYIESTPTSLLPAARATDPQEIARWKRMARTSPRTRARQHSEQARSRTGPIGSRPFPALHQKSGQST